MFKKPSKKQQKTLEHLIKINQKCVREVFQKCVKKSTAFATEFLSKNRAQNDLKSALGGLLEASWRPIEATWRPLGGLGGLGGLLEALEASWRPLGAIFRGPDAGVASGHQQCFTLAHFRLGDAKRVVL